MKKVLRVSVLAIVLAFVAGGSMAQMKKSGYQEMMQQQTSQAPQAPLQPPQNNPCWMNPSGMMGGFGMRSNMMGYGCRGWENCQKLQEEKEKFLEETKDLRRKLYILQFDYSEAARNPEEDSEKMLAMEKEMDELQRKIQEKASRSIQEETD
jgi:hypothetical protein